MKALAERLVSLPELPEHAFVIRVPTARFTVFVLCCPRCEYTILCRGEHEAHQLWPTFAARHAHAEVPH